MTATTMQFGPEWMRKAKPSARPQAASSPPPTSGGLGSNQNNSPAPPGASSYSSLVTPPVSSGQTKRDIVHPFKYSRDEMLQVWKDGGGSSTLPIEVERWEGIVREVAGDPVCLREFSETEKKLYATSINSEIRRRQSTDYMGQGDRTKGGALNNNIGLMGRRRRGDSSGADQPPLSISRKTSWSGGGNLISPSLASPRTRLGGGSFDGVLNGNDSSWGNGKRRVPSGQPFPERLEEEVEANKDTGASESQKEVSPTRKPLVMESVPSQTNNTSGNENLDSIGGVNSLKSRVENLTLNTNSNSPGLDSSGGDTSKTVDLGKIQWSYIDPSGNVQGPFPGETMQQWHEAHYFTDDLMMKRTTIDTEFMPLLEIKRRAQGERVFLSPLNELIVPPGLSRMPSGPGLNPLLQRSSVMDSPRQPSPQAFGRNIMDSWGGAATTGSASPSSSYGGNFSHGPVIPDPVAVGSRLIGQRFVPDVPLSGRISAGSYSSNDNAVLPHAVRHGFNDPTQNRTPFNPNIPWQTPQNNNLQGWNNVPSPNPQVIHDGFGGVNANQSPYLREAPYVPPPVQNIPDSYLPSNNFYEQSNQLDYNRGMIVQPEMNIQNGAFPHVQQEVPEQFSGTPQHLPIQQSSIGFVHDYDQTSSPVPVSPSVRMPQQQQQQPQSSQQLPTSPWGVPTAQRRRPFDPELPTIKNIIPTTPQVPQQSPWGRSHSETPSVPSVPLQDPWLPSQQTNNEWGHLTEEPQSLTTENVNQHNENQGAQPQRKYSEPVSAEVKASTQATAPTPEAPAVATKPAVSGPTPAEAAAQPTPSKRKTVATIQAQSPEKAQAVNPIAVKTPTTPSVQKTAWAKDDDSKSKAAAPMNLREIQEAEKKKQDARKAAEKERERAARATSSTAEEVQFTASWGLPTSQAGSRANNNSISVIKESHPAPTPVPSSAPVWTNAAKPAAKTMKEIQEEEEKRKQAAKEREIVTSVAKRAAAPAPKAATAVSGGAWTVVGAGGKSSAPTIPPGNRPANVQTSTPAVPPAPRPALVPTPRSVSSPQVAKANSNSKSNEDPGTPSPDFLKWMRESLRDLNSSVQFEEIAQMLLSFPLDPDSSTVELIAETVYGASTTVDGRRFASEFISRRKADSSSRAGSQGQSSQGVLSLADVVKAQPKSPQNEFGGYKVVKKKNKRS